MFFKVPRNFQTSIHIDSNKRQQREFISAQQPQNQIPQLPVQQQVPQQAPIVNNFHSKTSRQKFVFKVYAIFTTHLLLTVGIILLLLHRKNDWIDPILEHPKWTYTAWGITGFLLIIPIIVKTSFGGNSFPSNYIWLLMFTAGLGLTLTFLSIYLQTDIALFAVGIVSFITLMLALFSAQSVFGFNFLSGFLVMLVALVASYFLVIHIHNLYPNDPLSDMLYPNDPNKRLPLLYTSLLILGVVFIFRTCQIIDNKTGISPKNYVSTVLHLYIDVLIFVGFIAFFMVLMAHPRGRYLACRYIFRCGVLCSHRK